MPFENLPAAPTKIAVIGGGVSGMGAAYLLSQSHHVTLFENNTRLGGHARTVLAGKNGNQPVDTGFIVFNYENYPRLTRLFDELNVPVEKSDMSFGVSVKNGGIEYATYSLAALFAQYRNFVNPAFHGMLRDLMRFKSKAAVAAQAPEMTVIDLIMALRLGKWFQNYYLLPLSGAIWSTPLDEIMKFPAQALIRFFHNHGLMGYYKDQHQWYTVSGGSIEYVTRLNQALKNRGTTVHLGTPVKAVRRDTTGVWVRVKGGAWEQFDCVVFACHSDEALALLETPSATETRFLGDIRYQDNHAVLHCDPVVMPKRKACWSSWVYSEGTVHPKNGIGVTYWMNSLQNIPRNDLILETLNPTHTIQEDRIYDETTFRHPVFDYAALKAQEGLRSIQGQNNTWYCGAYMRNGFHEDGFSSGVDVAELIDGAGVWS